jgi:hypothetical protein
MKLSDATKNPNLLNMEGKRLELLDNCTRALCGDQTVDATLLDEATGGRYSQGDGENLEAIKTLLLALRWLALTPEKKTRKRRSTKNAAGAPAKKRGRPKNSKNKSTDNGAEPPVKTQHHSETPETGVTDQPSA